MSDSTIRRLRRSAEEIRAKSHAGWGNVCEQAADRIAELEAQLAAERDCPMPCGWKELYSIVIKDAAYLARDLEEGEPLSGNARATAIRLNSYLIDIIKAALQATAQEKTR